MIVGRFCDLAIDKPFSLAAFIVGDTIRIGVSSDHGREHYLVVTPDQARVVQGLLDLDEAQAAIDAGTVEPGFNTGVTVETPAGREFLVPVVDLGVQREGLGDPRRLGGGGGDRTYPGRPSRVGLGLPVGSGRGVTSDPRAASRG